jgi:SAM-dependent methyltransferase
VDPLAGSPWSLPGTVAGFAASAPNARLMAVAAAELARLGRGRALDIGCGAGRNAVPLACAGWDVVGVDLSWPMATAAMARRCPDGRPGRCRVALAAMERLPVGDGTCDLVIAHGIWNLAPSDAIFRAAVAEAARAARPGALCFVFTFSRHTLPPDAVPVPGEHHVFTQFSGRPQTFLGASDLVEEMARAGWTPDPRVPLVEHNRPTAAQLAGGAPVIYEGGFRVGDSRG